MLNTRLPGAGSKIPATTATPAARAAAASAAPNGPSGGAATGRGSQPKRICVASGNTARLALCAAASSSALRTRSRLTSGWELTGIWQRATRMSPP